MSAVTVEARSELLARYQERSAYRLHQEDPLTAAVGQVADDWFMMAIGMEGFYGEPLKVQWRVLRELIGSNPHPLRERLVHMFAHGMHVDVNNNRHVAK